MIIYQQYYAKQVRGGYSIYTGGRYERGHGFVNVAKYCCKPRHDVLRSGASIGSRALTDIVVGVPLIIYQMTYCGGRSTAGEQTIETQ